MPTTTRRTRTRTAPTPEADVADAGPLSRCVGDVERFLDDHFTRSPRLRVGGGFDDLLSLADVDAQLSGAGLRRPAVRVVRDGEVVDPSAWTRNARTGAMRIDDLVDPGRTLALFGDGATIVLQSLQRWWSPLIRFCRELEVELGHAVQANAYLTPSAAAGLTPHHDTHDVFVMQLHGTKHWTVREPLVVDPLPRHRSDHEQAARQPVLFEADLQPGDCLYLPRGFIHSAATQSGASLHLTVGVLATTVHDVLRRLVDRAAEEPAFRRTVRRHGVDEDTEREEFKGILAEFQRWLDSVDDGSCGGEVVSGAMSSRVRRTPHLDGQLLELVGLGEIGDDTRIVRRSPGAVPMRRCDDHVVVDLGDRTLELPDRLHEVVALLLDGSPRAVGDLGGLLDAPSRLVLVRRLIREGVLRTLHAS